MSLAKIFTPALHTVAMAGAFFLHHQRRFWPRVIAGACAVAAVSMTIVVLLEHPASLSTAFTLPILAFQIYFARYWLCMIATDNATLTTEQSVWSNLIPFIRYALLLALAFAVFVGPVGVVMLEALSGFPGVYTAGAQHLFTPETFLMQTLLAGPIFLALAGRFLLVFPSRAAGQVLTLAGSWRLTRGSGWYLFISQYICALIGLALFATALTVPWTLIEQGTMARLLAVGAISLAVTLASGVYIALATYGLTNLYLQRSHPDKR